MAPIRTLLSGGATGGHLVPGLNLAHALVAHGDGVQIVRTGRYVEDHFLQHGPDLPVHSLDVDARGLLAPLKIARALWPARRLLHEQRIDVVVGLGGRGSLPAILAARTSRVPIVLLEQNVVPGRTNRLLARVASRVYTVFPETAAHFPGRSVLCVGAPLRERALRDRGDVLRRRFGVEKQLVLLVVGGSQGARSLNLAIPKLLASLDESLRRSVAVIHLAGAGKEAEAARAYENAGIEVHILAFQHDMPALYSIVDLVICRGGGTSLAEIAAAGRPAIIVPFPWHRDRHQLANGEWFENRGAARVLEQGQLETPAAAQVVRELLTSGELRARMAEQARTALPRDATNRIVEDLHALAATRRVTTTSRKTARGAVG